jgi:hypothetical protein
VALATILSACTWVKTTPEGENIQVAKPDEVVNCESKGELTVSLKSRVAGFERKPGKVAGELETMARNDAESMGGDTIVARSNVKEGKQVFGVYRCR